MSNYTVARDDASNNSFNSSSAAHLAAGTLPKWDGTPIRASLFLRDIGEYAAQRGFLPLLLADYFVSKHLIIAANADVVARVKAHFNNPIAVPLPVDIQNPSRNPLIPSSDCTYTLTAEDKKSFCASPALFLCESSVHCQTLLSAISNPDVARRVRLASHGDARHVLCQIAVIRGELTPAQVAHHLSRIAAFTKKGITRISAAAWAAWKTQYDDLVFCLPATHALPGTYIAQDYTKAIQPLGPDFGLLVATEIKIRNANADAIATAAAIQMVTEEQELVQDSRGVVRYSVERRSEGAPSYNKDPRKLPRAGKGGRGGGRGGRTSFQTKGGKTSAPYPWNDSRRLCSNYGDPRCGDGRHLDRNCPINKAGGGRALAAHATTNTRQHSDTEDSIMSLLADETTDISPDSSPQHASGRSCYVACRPELQKRAYETSFYAQENIFKTCKATDTNNAVSTQRPTTTCTTIFEDTLNDDRESVASKTASALTQASHGAAPLGDITNKSQQPVKPHTSATDTPPASLYSTTHSAQRHFKSNSSDAGSETESYESSEPELPGAKPLRSPATLPPRKINFKADKGLEWSELELLAGIEDTSTTIITQQGDNLNTEPAAASSRPVTLTEAALRDWLAEPKPTQPWADLCEESVPIVLEPLSPVDSLHSQDSIDRFILALYNDSAPYMELNNVDTLSQLPADARAFSPSSPTYSPTNYQDLEAKGILTPEAMHQEICENSSNITTGAASKLSEHIAVSLENMEKEKKDTKTNEESLHQQLDALNNLPTNSAKKRNIKRASKLEYKHKVMQAMEAIKKINTRIEQSRMLNYTVCGLASERKSKWGPQLAQPTAGYAFASKGKKRELDTDDLESIDSDILEPFVDDAGIAAALVVKDLRDMEQTVSCKIDPTDIRSCKIDPTDMLYCTSPHSFLNDPTPENSQENQQWEYHEVEAALINVNNEMRSSAADLKANIYPGVNTPAQEKPETFAAAMVRFLDESAEMQPVSTGRACFSHGTTPISIGTPVRRLHINGRTGTAHTQLTSNRQHRRRQRARQHQFTRTKAQRKILFQDGESHIDIAQLLSSNVLTFISLLGLIFSLTLCFTLKTTESAENSVCAFLRISAHFCAFLLTLIISLAKRAKHTERATAFAARDTHIGKAVTEPVIDSGTTWHSHPIQRDLINLRPSNERLEAANGDIVKCSGIGDLPCASFDTNGRLIHYTIKSVRYVPSYVDTLISVRQLWAEQKINAVFGDTEMLVFADGIRIPMRWQNGVYSVRMVINPARRFENGDINVPGARALASHNARSHSHIQKLSPNAAAQLMHNRLHLSLEKIKNIARNSKDAPSSLKLANNINCQACAQANARAHSHPIVGYSPSCVGRMIQMDDAGPHSHAALGGARYFRVFVDSHSRFRLTYLLKTRADGLAATERFIAEFNSLAGADPKIQLIQIMHTDNAPEIVSNAFQNLLQRNGIVHRTSPAHIKQSNGIAERAIGTTRAIARSAMTAANAPLWSWGCAVLHAEDVLNHCNGPSNSNKCHVDGISSYQLLTGESPYILGIMPFGCLAIATKPPRANNKIAFGHRGARAINLGRSREQPGAYRLWCPSEGKLIVTSDVTFFEQCFPWHITGRKPQQILATTERNSSTTILNIFSGPYNRPDGLTAALHQLGYDVIEVDNSTEFGGGHKHDILNDQFFNSLLHDANNKRFRAVLAAPPCSTFSVSRFYDFSDPKRPTADRGPPPVRDRQNILGLPNVPEKHLRELREANSIIARLVAIIEAAAAGGASWWIEQPADRGNPLHHITYDEKLKQHGPLWLMPSIIELQKKHSAHTVTFAQCMYSDPPTWQKYTTLMFSEDLLEHLGPMAKMCCNHRKEEHSGLKGKTKEGTWLSNKASAYPPKLATALASALPPIENKTSASNTTTDNSPHQPDQSPEDDNHSTTATVGTNSGPRPDGGTFNLRSNRYDDNRANTPSPNEKHPAQASPDSSKGPRPGGGTFNLRTTHHYEGKDKTYERDPEHTCSIEQNMQSAVEIDDSTTICVVPNSITGRALQAVESKPEIASPKGRKTALKQNREGWLASEAKELEAHARNKSWSTISLSQVPAGRKLVRMLWVYRIKRDGTLKARLCVMGSSQRPGIDFDQTYCATMRAASLRLLAAISAAMGLSMWRMDFVSAYLQGRLEDGEVIFAHMPEGYETVDAEGRPNVLQIEKPVYGMAQAGRRWQRSLFPWLIKFGFQQSNYDPCIFIMNKSCPKDRTERILIGCYVDDLLICTSHTDAQSLFKQFSTNLRKDWEVEEEGEAVDLLNVQFVRTDKGILLHQRPYIESMVTRFAPDGIPLAFQRNWSPCSGDLPELVRRAMENDNPPDPSLLKSYQQLVGALLYCATNTRPDIAFAVGVLCRAMSRPTPILHKAALRVLYYLARHADIGLHYEADPSAIIAYSDSDLGTKHSTTGWDIRWQKATISFGSKKQVSVATSSCHAEIVAASEAAKEAKFYRDFATELGFPQPQPTPLLVDNTATIDLAYNPEFHNRTKHIDRRHFYIRELVEQHNISVRYVHTSENLADFFTKALPPKHFFKLRDKIMNIH